MERFTYFEHGRWRIMIFGVEYAGFPWVDAFAAYENTGLTPDEIAALKNPPNSPLTLDELREMDGEPVWVEGVPELGTSGGWEICSWGSKNIITFSRCMASPDLRDYGVTWRAYRRRPEVPHE